MTRERRIVRSEIGPMPRPKPGGLLDPMPRVTAHFDDGSSEELFEFYPDEVNFDPSEFEGLTEREAHGLRRNKDVAYLRS